MKEMSCLRVVTLGAERVGKSGNKLNDAFDFN